jgi:THO complex subunit 5
MDDHADATTMLDKLPADFDPSNLNIADLLKTVHNERLYQTIQALKTAVNELVDYELAHPKKLNPATRDEIDKDKKAARELVRKELRVKSQLAVVKTLFRQSLLKVREDKARTADEKAVNDALILGLSNLKYEEQSLRSEIAGAENFECVLCFLNSLITIANTSSSHKYTKLPLISREEFLDHFPEYASASEHDLMIARIEHERLGRVKLEERRQAKLKEKQTLISEVKKSKENLTNLDSMVDKIEEAMAPIRKVLANDE